MEIGPLHVRRSAFIQASPETVWKEFAAFDRINAWLGRGHSLHEFETEVGGTVRLSVLIDGEEQFYGGRVLVYDAAREVSFETQWDEPNNWPVPTFWTFRLSAINDGTSVELFHHGFERLGDAAAENLQGYEDGWDCKHLKALRRIVEG